MQPTQRQRCSPWRSSRDGGEHGGRKKNTRERTWSSPLPQSPNHKLPLRRWRVLQHNRRRLRVPVARMLNDLRSGEHRRYAGRHVALEKALVRLPEDDLLDVVRGVELEDEAHPEGKRRGSRMWRKKRERKGNAPFDAAGGLRHVQNRRELLLRDWLELDRRSGGLRRQVSLRKLVLVVLAHTQNDSKVDHKVLMASVDVEFAADETEDAEQFRTGREEDGVGGEGGVLVDEVEDDDVQFGVGEREELDGGLDGVRVGFWEGLDRVVCEEGEDGVGFIVCREHGEAAEGGEDESAIGRASEGDEEGEEADGGRVEGFGKGSWSRVFVGVVSFERIGDDGVTWKGERNLVCDPLEHFEEVQPQLRRLLRLDAVPFARLKNLANELLDPLARQQDLGTLLDRCEVPEDQRRLCRSPLDRFSRLLPYRKSDGRDPARPIRLPPLQVLPDQPDEPIEQSGELGEAEEVGLS